MGNSTSSHGATPCVIAVDSETGLIRPACLAPSLACITWQEKGAPAQIADSTTSKAHLRRWLLDPSVLFTTANGAYDFGVFAEAYPDLRPLIFKAYDDDRVTDVQIRQKLLDIAAGVYRGRVVGKGKWIPHEYSLEALARRCAGIELQKDAWRLSYSEFIGIPLSEWPARAREVQAKAVITLAELRAAWANVKPKDIPKEVPKTIAGLEAMITSSPDRCTEYPLDDARATLSVHEKQEVHGAYLHDQYRQARGAFWLHLSSAWGLRTSKDGVAKLLSEVQAEYDELEAEMIGLGLVRSDKKRSRNTKLAKALMIEVCKENGLTLRRTDGHDVPDTSKCKDVDGKPLPAGHDDCAEHVCLDAEACEATDDPTIMAYAELTTLKKVLSNDLNSLANGTVYPLHTKYNLAETGRTTSSKPPIQNLSKRGGIRECFVPRPGHVFWQVDYPTLELYTLAQCCMTWLGHSELAEVLNTGKDPHLAFGASMVRIDYDDAKKAYKDPGHSLYAMVKRARQLAKPANFGFPGGMGAKKFVAATRKQLLKEQNGRALWNDLEASIISLVPEMERKGADAVVKGVQILKDEWFIAFPEMPEHFARINALCATESGRAMVETLWTRRFRGNATYCAASNNGFQGLGVDCAKEAGWRIAKAQYVDESSPMFGSRTVAFVHDEFIGECVDDERAHDVANAAADHMVEGANIYLPDVPMPRAKLEPTLMRVWSKNAVQVFDANDRLVPWQVAA